jgi:hypothetical protein
MLFITMTRRGLLVLVHTSVAIRFHISQTSKSNIIIYALYESCLLQNNVQISLDIQICINIYTIDMYTISIHMANKRIIPICFELILMQLPEKYSKENFNVSSEGPSSGRPRLRSKCRSSPWIFRYNCIPINLAQIIQDYIHIYSLYEYFILLLHCKTEDP